MSEIQISRGNKDFLGPTYLDGDYCAIKYAPYKDAAVLESQSVSRLSSNGSLNSFSISRKSKNIAKVQSPILRFTTSPAIGYPSIYFQIQNVPIDTRLLCAREWININKVLLQDGLCLIDANIDNFTFHKASEPIWIDPGSIRPVKNGVEGITGFNSALLFPLILLNRERKVDRDQTFRNIWSIPRITFAEARFIPLFSYNNSSFTVAILSLIGRLPIQVPVRLIRRLALGFLSFRLRTFGKLLQLDSNGVKSLNLPSQELISKIDEVKWASVAIFDSIDSRWLSFIERSHTARVVLSNEESRVMEYNSWIRDRGQLHESDFVGLIGTPGYAGLHVDILVVRVGIYDLIEIFGSIDAFVDELLRNGAQKIALEIIESVRDESKKQEISGFRNRLVERALANFEVNIISQNSKYISLYLVRETNDQEL